MSGFGRKGLAENDEIARKREAFLAAERARSEANPSFAYVETPAARTQYHSKWAQPAEKSLLVAYLLWFFAGTFSAHRFYLGAHRSAWSQVAAVFGGAVLVGIAAKTHTGPPGAIGGGAMIIGVIWIMLDMILLPFVHRRLCKRAIEANAAAAFA